VTLEPEERTEMKYRYRHLTDGQLIGVHLLTRIAGTTHDAIRLSNRCLQHVLDVGAVHDGRASDFAQSLAPFFPSFKIENWRGYPKTLLLKPRADLDPKSVLSVDTLPSPDDLEKQLQITIKHFETEHIHQRVVRELRIDDKRQQVVKKADW